MKSWVVDCGESPLPSAIRHGRAASTRAPSPATAPPPIGTVPVGDAATSALPTSSSSSTLTSLLTSGYREADFLSHHGLLVAVANCKLLDVITFQATSTTAPWERTTNMAFSNKNFPKSSDLLSSITWTQRDFRWTLSSDAYPLRSFKQPSKAFVTMERMGFRQKASSPWDRLYISIKNLRGPGDLLVTTDVWTSSPNLTTTVQSTTSFPIRSAGGKSHNRGITVSVKCSLCRRQGHTREQCKSQQQYDYCKGRYYTSGQHPNFTWQHFPVPRRSISI